MGDQRANLPSPPILNATKNKIWLQYGRAANSSSFIVVCIVECVWKLINTFSNCVTRATNENGIFINFVVAAPLGPRRRHRRRIPGIRWIRFHNSIVRWLTKVVVFRTIISTDKMFMLKEYNDIMVHVANFEFLVALCGASNGARVCVL